MIAGLYGNVERPGAGRVYFRAGALVYEIYVPLNVQAYLQDVGVKEIYLHIYHQFTDSDQRLFGFLNLEQRDFFIAIQNIKGIGAVLALSILSHLEIRDLLTICDTKDFASLTRIPRVGKATAETIIFEVSRKKKKWQALLGDDAYARSAGSDLSPVEELAAQALVQLGYKEKEIEKVYQSLRSTEPSQSAKWQAADWIAAALRVL